MLIRDDCSSDNTRQIISNYADSYPGKIVPLTDYLGNLGACGNFARLLELTDADYIMFCDGDDVWLENKIELTFDRMKVIENEYGINTPVLVHTDLTVTDEQLKPISKSYWNYQKINPKYDSINHLLVQNVVTGCTAMINKSLSSLVSPVPKDVIMHDWWIALNASIFGKIDFLSDPTILYRQHNANDTGAKKWGAEHIFRRLFQKDEIRKKFAAYERQAQLLLERHQGKLNTGTTELITTFAFLSQSSALSKRYNLLKYKIYKYRFTRNVGLFLFI